MGTRCVRRGLRGRARFCLSSRGGRPRLKEDLAAGSDRKKKVLRILKHHAFGNDFRVSAGDSELPVGNRHPDDLRIELQTSLPLRSLAQVEGDATSQMPVEACYRRRLQRRLQRGEFKIGLVLGIPALLRRE